MFHKDTKTRTDARNTFLKHIDNAICANYGSDLHITHKFVDKNENEILKIGIANNLFKDKDPRYFRQGRNQDLCNDVKGGILYCGECNQTVSTVDIVNMSLQRWKDTLNPGKRAQLNRPDMNNHFENCSIYFLVPYEWRLCIRKRCFLGKQACKRNIIEVQIRRTLILSRCILLQERL